MIRRIPVVEGEPIRGLSVDEARATRARVNALAGELRPRKKFLSSADPPAIQNLVGAIQVTPNLILDVVPKTQPGEDWAAALIDLLLPHTRVSFNAEHAQAQRTRARTLPDAFAALYARQLDKAVRAEGPLTTIEPYYTQSPMLSGRLDVSRWVTSRVLSPATFPQHRTHLTPDNPFTKAMAYVADLLARRTTDASTASRLRHITARLRPGLPSHALVDPGVALRSVPPQWRAYEAPWSTACVVLRNLSLLHRNGTLDGLGLALEPWPLLETLTERTAKAIATRAASAGLGGLTGAGHTKRYDLRTPVEDTAKGTESFHKLGSVDPDGLITHGKRPLVAFEAKYTVPSVNRVRTHSFQALTTAAALRAPVSVLVYPTAFEPVQWSITGFGGAPGILVAVGLDLFGYRAGEESARAEPLFRALEPMLRSAMLTP